MEYDQLDSRARWPTLLLLIYCFTSTAAESTVPLGLPELPLKSHSSNPTLTTLGGELFFDRRLSADGTVSCGSCHRPERDFTDGRQLAIGISGHIGTRNAPSLFNVVYATTLFWDGRAANLESQAMLPLQNSREHGLPTEAALLARLNAAPTYRQRFAQVFGRGRITSDAVMTAIATYERTLLAGNSPFDRYLYGGDHHAMTDSAIRGLEFFRGRARCAGCHTIGKTSALLTDQEFHASPTGLPDSVNSKLVELTQLVVDAQRRGDPKELNSLVTTDAGVASLGRFVVTRNPNDIGLFKTPSLRNVAATAPYLHDGSLATLQEVVDAELYSRGDEVRYPIVATAQDKTDLIEFLHALSSPESSTH